MARKKAHEPQRSFERSAEVTLQPITETIEKNYMPYIMTVIISRAIPQIDGFKPSHRKLLYTMYDMKLMTGARTKSANVVGQTMRLNPHGDASIYETMVRLTRGNAALLHPFIDSKGSFGKQYSSDMAYSAPRYTEVKLAPICAEIFRGIDKDAVDFIPNYDNTLEEPVLLPTSFPNILISPNMGIAVGMASRICSFNLAEICDGTIQILKNPDTSADRMLDIIKAPDFSGGGYILYDRDQLREIYETGRGSFKLRARYTYDKQANCIDIIQIPYSTTIEQILKRLTDLVKEGKLKEVVDFRDEIDLNGFKLTIDIRRGTDPDKLMTKLFKLTPLEDDFGCNFNVLIDNVPRTMGICEILREWVRFRMTCVRRELTYDLKKKKDKLHLLLGLGKILLDIDKAIKIVRETEKECDVVPNLMLGFDIDEIQAEYIAEIRLRNLNREYIINRIKEIEGLQTEIAELEELISSDSGIRNYIAAQLREIKKKYALPRQTQLLAADEVDTFDEDEMVENYNVRLILTKEGYFKKITLLSLRGNDEQKFKEGDALRCEEDSDNLSELLFFTDKAQVYKAKTADFDVTKASQLGDFIPAKLGFDEDENVIYMKCLSKYEESHNMIYLFENGKGVRVPISSYETKTNRKKLTNAFSDASPIVAAFYESETCEIVLINDAGRAIAIDSSLIPIKTTRTSQGVALMNLKKNQKLTEAQLATSGKIENIKRYRKTKLPATGVLLEKFDAESSQISLE